MKQGIQYIVYDLSIEDLKERQEKAVVYDSGRKVSAAIGIGRTKIALYTNPKDQKKYYSLQLKRHFAIRVKSGNP